MLHQCKANAEGRWVGFTLPVSRCKGTVTAQGSTRVTSRLSTGGSMAQDMQIPVMLHPRVLLTSTPAKGSHPAKDPTSWQCSAFTHTHKFPYTLRTPMYKPSPPSAKKPDPSTWVLGTRSAPQLSTGWSSLCSSQTDDIFC